jgi:hypothetical protein
VTFLHDHRGMPVASPAVFEQIGIRFRQAVDTLANFTVCGAVLLPTSAYPPNAAATSRHDTAAVCFDLCQRSA